MTRLNSAKEILKDFAGIVNIREYECAYESCGHTESVILSYPGYISVCYSLEQLKQKVSNINVKSPEDLRAFFLCTGK